VFFLFGCETWSVTRRGEHRMRVLESRTTRLCGAKGGAVASCLGRFLIGEL